MSSRDFACYISFQGICLKKMNPCYQFSLPESCCKGSSDSFVNGSIFLFPPPPPSPPPICSQCLNHFLRAGLPLIKIISFPFFIFCFLLAVLLFYCAIILLLESKTFCCAIFQLFSTFQLILSRGLAKGLLHWV